MAKKLESIIINPSLIRDQWLSPELAVRAVLAFERRFGEEGEKYLKLACHAALPSILTPELINLIHINFLGNLEIDWIAEMDFLLSPLCHSIEEEVYEVEPCVREVLLIEMENLYGEERAEEIKKEIAKFLWVYLQQKPPAKQRPEFRKTQEWIARAYLDPDGLIQKMRESLQSSFAEENSLLQLSQQIPVVRNLELLSEPLVKVQQKENYQQLMQETRVVAHVLYGEEQITEVEEGISLLSSPFLGWLKQSSKIDKTQTEEPVVTSPLPTIPKYLEAHFRKLIDAITHDYIVPVLGSEINLCDRPLQENGEPEKWHLGCEFPPTDSEVAAYLIDYLIDESGDEPRLGDEFSEKTLPQVAQYFELTLGRNNLNAVLNEIYSTNYRPNQLHRFLAKLPAIMGSKGYFPPYPLFVTTCYDTTLERAFKEVNEPFALVAYFPHQGGSFLHQLPGREISLIYEANKYYKELSLEEYPIIIKLYASTDCNQDNDAHCIITEDQIVNYLNKRSYALLPAQLLVKLLEKSIWFLGCSQNDLKIRFALNSIWQEYGRTFRSTLSLRWAIQAKTDFLDRKIWQSKNVELIELPLSDYVTELEKRLKEWPDKLKQNEEVPDSKQQPQIDIIPETPFKGLMPYSEESALFFFGREREREMIINNLRASRLTILYGASGVGKSSILRAGVAYQLRQIAEQNLKEHGKLNFAVVVFNSWGEDPIVGLKQQIEAEIKAMLPDIQSPAPELSFVETLQAWTEILGGEEGHGRLFIILDQFEEYFLYYPQEDSEGTFAVEFPRAVNQPDLSVNFLISIRDDALAKLDRFRERIPNILDNRISIQYLDLESAKEAIVKPIEAYNRWRKTSISIEPELVEAVLEQVKDNEGRIESAYLQTIMSSLWDAEIKAGSNHLQLKTFNDLGSLRGIIEQYLEQQMTYLTEKEQESAANIFNYLITPSGIKIAYSVPDLAELTQLNESKLRSLLDELSSVRILRPLIEDRYEIFHDVLAAPILNWRRQYLEKQSDISLKPEGVNYSQLENLLEQQKWREADEETANIILQVLGTNNWLDVKPENIDTFPCEDLQTIDKLWVKYSQGHFGFSIQKKIWQEVGGKVEMDSEKKLGERIGWHKNRKWLNQLELIFSLDAPPGHLPAITEGRLAGIRPWISHEAGVYSPPSEGWGISSLLQRFITCKEKAASESKTEIPLKSERNIDYTKLRDFLAAGNWKEADRETLKVMCQATRRESEGWLRVEDIGNFPCEDLLTINQLWLHYSQGKFGFSAQKEIYESLGGTKEDDGEVWKKFCERVGWKKGENWLSYSDLSFNLELASPAHLPCFGWWGVKLGRTMERRDVLAVGQSVRYFSLAQRFTYCSANIQRLPKQKIELKSEKGVDYTKLRDHLEQQQWQEADKETAERMLEAIGRESPMNINRADIDTFPCEDLRTIDQLWVAYSQAHFGFSIQEKIWQEVGGKVDYETENKFGDRLGWRKGGDWLNYSDLTFNLNAPVGHLPGIIFGLWMSGGIASQGYDTYEVFFFRTKNCNIKSG